MCELSQPRDACEYDLQADPGECEDLAGEYPDIVREMRAAYEAWFDETTDRFRENIISA
jgi:hypothetical protein